MTTGPTGSLPSSDTPPHARRGRGFRGFGARVFGMFRLVVGGLLGGVGVVQGLWEPLTQTRDGVLGFLARNLIKRSAG